MERLTLNSAVAGPKMAHLTKITLSFEFSSAHPDGARVKASEKFKGSSRNRVGADGC